MRFIDVLREECISLETKADDKQSVLVELAALAKKCKALKKLKEADILEGFTKRESLGSTGFGDGIAIPHCAIKGVNEFVVGILVSKAGIEFDSIDGNPVNVFVFIVGSEEDRNRHIYLLSVISRVLSEEKLMKELLAAKNPTALREAFLMHVADSVVDKEKEKEMALVHVIIQNQSYFEDIVQVLSEFEDTSMSILEANDASRYLNSLPVFHAFMSDQSKGYNRIIVAVVHKPMVGEIIRQISSITGGLEDANKIAVVAQDVTYFGGSLNF